MPYHTGLSEVGVEVLSAMINAGEKLERVLVVVEKLSESLSIWSKLSNLLPVDPVCIVNDETDGRLDAENFTSTMAKSFGMRVVTTDTKKLADVLNSTGPQAIICPANRYAMLKSALDQVDDLNRKTFDLMICESLLSTTMEWLEPADGGTPRKQTLSKQILPQWLKNKYIPARNRLFLSSTTMCFRYWTSSSWARGLAGFQPGAYGPIVFQMPRSAAVERGLLRPIEIVRWTSASLGRKFSAEDLEVQAEAIKSFMSTYGVERMYAFAISIDDGRDLKDHLDALLLGQAQSGFMEYKMNLSERDTQSQVFASEEPGVIVSFQVIFENRSALPADAAFMPPSKTSGDNFERTLDLLSKPFLGSDGHGRLFLLGDNSATSERSLTLALTSLILDEPFLINSLRHLVLLSVAQGKDLPMSEWPPELSSLILSDAPIPRKVLMETYEMVRQSFADAQ